MTVGDSIVIRANDVLWDSPEWSDSPHIMRIGEIELSVTTASLFEPPVIIERGFARDAELEFEWTEDEHVDIVIFSVVLLVMELILLINSGGFFLLFDMGCLFGSI